MYVALAAGFVVRYGDRRARPAAARWSRGSPADCARAGRAAPTPIARARSPRSPRDWRRRATPLYAARAARILHLAAAAFALGVIAGLYVRGLAFEYRATWESTFLDAASGARARSRSSTRRARASPACRCPTPRRSRRSARPRARTPRCGCTSWPPRSRCVVIVPRLLLALARGWSSATARAHLVDDLDEPYFARLLRGFRQGPSPVRVVPYSYTVSAGRARVRSRRCSRARSAATRTVALAPPVAYGDEDAAARALDGEARGAGDRAVQRHGHARARGARPLPRRARARTRSARWSSSSTSPRSTRAGATMPARRDARRALWRERAAARHRAGVRRPAATATSDARRGGARDGPRRERRHDGRDVARAAVSAPAPPSRCRSSRTPTRARRRSRARCSARDVGEVRDAPHVTTEATAYPLIETDDGDTLLLWDTPGFGDSARLARRLAQDGNPIGWFLSQVWDRCRDRPFWLTQLAVRNVRDHADVGALPRQRGGGSRPTRATSPPSSRSSRGSASRCWCCSTRRDRRATPEDEAQDVARWRAALAAHRARARRARLRRVRALLGAGVRAVRRDRRRCCRPTGAPPFARLADAWRARRWAQFDAAMAALAQPVAAAICARVVVPPTPMLRRLGTALGVGGDDARPTRRAARCARSPSALDADMRDGDGAR